MTAKFCCRDDCFEVAVRAARSSLHCRPHYLEDVLAGVELVRFEVTSPTAKITDCVDQVSKGRGYIVHLDPAETDVAMLVAAGLGRVVAKPVAKPAEKPAKPKADD